MWEACGEDPEELELEHLPTFEVDVQRRWPSVEKARRLLDWEARIDARGGDRLDRAAGCGSSRSPSRAVARLPRGT